VQWSHIQSIFPQFTEQIKQSNYSKNELISLNQNDSIQISYSITTIKLLDETLKIVNFQNIKSVLDRNEMQAWNNLIRTMTHEIMNSVTPIISLAESGLKIVGSHANSNFPEQLTPKNIEHLNKSFTSIYNKSLWLKTFVDDYRKLIRIPQPITKEVNLKEFIGLCLHSLSEMLVKDRVGAIVDINNITLHIDPNLIEQVVVNLIKNSVEAMQTTENKQIEITAQEQASSILLHFTDNGEGISPENIPKIFIPFFTTKQGGSGIGLSLSKQIMQLHNGNIKVAVENGRTVFTLVFPGA
jgi:nitrogen fixation/metabolism regulation signal transduction histidine kinase